MEWTVNRRLPQQLGNRLPGMAPHGVYRCRVEDRQPTGANTESQTGARREDRWVAIAVQNDAEWQALREAMGDPAWAADERFGTLLGRMQHEDALDEQLEAWTVERSAEEVMLLLQRRGIAAGVVQSMEDILSRDPQMRARGALQPIEHPQAGVRQYPAPAFQLSRTPPVVIWVSPLQGEHSWEVLHEYLGMTREEYDRLDAEGITGEGPPPGWTPGSGRPSKLSNRYSCCVRPASARASVANMLPFAAPASTILPSGVSTRRIAPNERFAATSKTISQNWPTAISPV